MKKSIFSLLLATLVLLCVACGSTGSYKNMYDALSIPQDIHFGMNAHELAEVLGVDDLREAGRGSFSVFPSDALDNYCSVFKVEYTLYDEKNIEFEDNYELYYIKYEIIDLIEYSKRTSERHGDIGAEYENIKAYLTGIYGEPFLSETDYGIHDGKRIIWWDTDAEVGVTLILHNTTTSLSRGEMTLQYADTSKLVDDWYER